MLFSPDDTIVALATPPGRGGLAVVRLSGRRARAIAAGMIAGSGDLEPRRATLVRVTGKAGVAAEGGQRATPLDDAVATLFAGPASYTGEDVVEFSLHGSPVVATEVIEAAVGAGARLAGPGEFTLRAFLNGRLDLTRAEAVADLVDATTPLQARMAFDQLQGTLAGRIAEIERSLFELMVRLEASGDFPEEGYHFVSPQETRRVIREARARVDLLLAGARRGQLLREGITVAIAGRPNVGKSSVFNRLVGVDRAIVTAVPGTTRDLLLEPTSLAGARMTLVDTAGVRTTADPVELEGVARAEKASAAADVVLVVLDVSSPLTGDDRRLLERTADRVRVVAANKSDLPAAWKPADACRHLADGGVADAAGLRDVGVIAISAMCGTGFEELIGAINRRVGISQSVEPPAVSNIRQIELLGHVTETLARAGAVLSEEVGQLPEELVLADLRIAMDLLQEVTGKRTTDDLLSAIFSRFCVGK